MTTAPGDYITDTVTCKHCGATGLAWYQTKAGQWMLANTAPSQNDRKRLRGVRYITPWAPHRCEDEHARRDRDAAEQRDREIDDRLRELLEAQDAALDAGDTAEFERLRSEAREVYRSREGTGR